MPAPDDFDPIQDAKHAREAATATAEPAPTLGDLYREWSAANNEWSAVTAELATLRKKEDLARAKASDLERQLGAAALADVPREMGRTRGEFVVMGGALYYVRESECGVDGYHYEIRHQPVRKLSV